MPSSLEGALFMRALFSEIRFVLRRKKVRNQIITVLKAHTRILGNTISIPRRNDMFILDYHQDVAMKYTIFFFKKLLNIITFHEEMTSEFNSSHSITHLIKYITKVYVIQDKCKIIVIT